MDRAGRRHRVLRPLSVEPSMSTPPGAAAARNPAGRSENVFTHKIGPLPMWGWLGIVSVAIVAWAWWQNRNSGNLNTQPSNTTNASQVPQFVNQTYVSANPPSTPGTQGAVGGTVTVPNVVGMTDTEGDAAIKAVGLKVADTNERKGGSGGSTKITGQSPAGGTQVPPGSSVSVTLAGGTAKGGVNAGGKADKGEAEKPKPGGVARKPRPRVARK